LPFCSRCGAQAPAGATFCPSCGSPIGAAGAQQQVVPISGISTVSRDVQAQQYWVKRLLAYIIDAIVVYAVIGLAAAAAALPAFLKGVFVPGYSPRIFPQDIPTGYSHRIFPFGAYFGTFAGIFSSCTSPSRRRPTARRSGRRSWDCGSLRMVGDGLIWAPPSLGT
jgi:zinc-ribbon domain